MTANIIIPIIIVLFFVYFWRKEQQNKQLKYIKNYKFSPVLLKRVQEKHDYLTPANMKKVEEALRDYFYICNQAKGKMVAMPSEIVDVAWHEFLLFTREYQIFCKKAFGRFLHHTPTEAMKSKFSAQTGIKRAWRLACAKEKIDPQTPKKLPLIFAIDKKLNIKGGFTYALNCQSKSSTSSSCGGYCATDIGCTSSCVGASGHESSSSDSSGFFSDSSSSDSSGCGGGGCGGD